MASLSLWVVCAVLLLEAAVLATPFRDARDVGVGDAADAAAPAPADVAQEQRMPADVLDDDLARKKAKQNTTVGEEVITAIVDGLTGESEDAKFGSEIREQFGYLVQAVTKLGVTTINKYAGGNTRAAEGQPAPCGQDAGGDCEEHTAARAARGARDVDNVGTGRRRQVRRLLVRYLVLLKVFALGIILPGAVLLSLLQSWKAVTVSLMALLLAGVIGIRGLVNTAASAKGQPAEVIHTTGPGSHYWRRVSAEPGQEADRLAYGAYLPVS